MSSIENLTAANACVKYRSQSHSPSLSFNFSHDLRFSCPFSVTSCTGSSFQENTSVEIKFATVWAFLSGIAYFSGQLVNQYTKLNLYLFPQRVFPYVIFMLTIWKKWWGILIYIKAVAQWVLLCFWHSRQLFTYSNICPYDPGQNIFHISS